jgi:hypothetical protein
LPPDFNPLEEREQLFLLRRKLVREVGGAEHGHGKAARHEVKSNDTKKLRNAM